jgi:tetratricopeptide (TPR) repeat protein
MQDSHGNTLTGASRTAAAHYDDAVEAFALYSGDPIAAIDAAIADSPDCASAHIAKALLFGLATEPAARDAARLALNAASGLRMNDRETSLAGATAHLLAGDWTEAALALDHHHTNWPHDFLAIQSGHLIDFFRANARDLRDRIARTLPNWSADMALFPMLLGMHAFGLEESGDYARAEEAGRGALALDRRDSWAHHAVAHVMEMQGRAEDGIGWMIAREADWAGADNFFRVHNWWHRALCHLNLEQFDQALALYDANIGGPPTAVAVNLVDASALLWRLTLLGTDVGTRWDAVSDLWQGIADGALYPFNDWHAAMADLGAGRLDRLDARLATMRAAAQGPSETARWIAGHGIPLVEGFTAFWNGDNATAATLLHRHRFIANSFGGSHAQRDVIDWTLAEAALRGGMTGLAASLAHERLALKPFNPLDATLLRRSQS